MHDIGAEISGNVRTGRPVLAASACGRLAAYLQSTPPLSFPEPPSHALPLRAPLWRWPPLPHPACPLYVFIETVLDFVGLPLESVALLPAAPC